MKTANLPPSLDDLVVFAAVAEAHARLESLREEYLRDFGVAPQFRAVLHAGEVVTVSTDLQKVIFKKFKYLFLSKTIV